MFRFLTATLASLLAVSTAHADYAFVITSTICDNQADSVDYEWSRLNRSAIGKPVLMFFDKTGFTRLEGAGEFDKLSPVVVAAHGAATTIADVPKATFAEKLKAAHNNAPEEVQFVVCRSAYKPPSTKTLLGLIADQYPNPAKKGETLIGTMSGTSEDCRLRKPGQAVVTDLAKAIYYQSVKTTDDGGEITKILEKKWKETLYPKTQDSFETYCGKVLAGDRKKFSEFIGQVNTTFGEEYLSLVNQNYDGAPPYVCGSKTANKICE